MFEHRQTDLYLIRKNQIIFRCLSEVQHQSLNVAWALNNHRITKKSRLSRRKLDAVLSSRLRTYYSRTKPFNG